MEIKEAEISQTDEPQEIQVSTNELVFMIGEAVVRDRQNLKRLQFLDKQVEIARDETLKAKSLTMGYQQKVEAFEAVKTSLEEVKASLNARILDMEKQLHELALERDTYRNKLAALQKKRKTRKSKGVKQAANTTRD